MEVYLFMYSSFTNTQRPGFYIPNPMGYQGPGDAYGPYPNPGFDFTPPGTGGYQPQPFSSGFNFNSSFGLQMPSYGSGFSFGSSFNSNWVFAPPAPPPQPSLPDFNFNFNNFNFPTFLNSNITTLNTSTDSPNSTNETTTTNSGGYIPEVFDPVQLNENWGNTNIPFDWATTASGLYGNVHGLSAILSRYVGDIMPSAQQDPTAPGNTWMFTTFPSLDEIF